MAGGGGSSSGRKLSSTTYQVWRSWSRLFGCTTAHGPHSEEYTRLWLGTTPFCPVTLYKSGQLAGLAARYRQLSSSTSWEANYGEPESERLAAVSSIPADWWATAASWLSAAAGCLSDSLLHFYAYWWLNSVSAREKFIPVVTSKSVKPNSHQWEREGVPAAAVWRFLLQTITRDLFSVTDVQVWRENTTSVTKWSGITDYQCG